MKKSLLKASLICLGITLLCGLSSFKTPEGVKSPRSNASFVYDTLITPVGEEPQCIKEVAVESDQGDCVCSLIVDESSPSWSLKINKSCSQSVRATFKCLIYFKNGDTKSYEDTKTIIYNGDTPIQIPTDIISFENRSLDNSRCVPVQIGACFVN